MFDDTFWAQKPANDNATATGTDATTSRAAQSVTRKGAVSANDNAALVCATRRLTSRAARRQVCRTVPAPQGDRVRA